MKASKKERKKEDHLAPTNIKQDNNPSTIKAIKYLSDKELQERLDLYSNGSQEQFFKVQKIKNGYIEQIRDEQAQRTKADLHYAQGIRAGLPHTHHSSIKDSRELTDQNFRDEIVKEAKTEYKKHKNLTRLFDRGNTREKNIEQSKNSRQQKKVKTYNQLGKLMGEYKAVQIAKDKTVNQLKQLEANPENHLSVKALEPDQKIIEKQQKNLSKYFNKHEPVPQEIRKTFEKIKGMDRDR